MNPDVRDTEPGAALFSYAEMAVSQIWALSSAVPGSGGPCQSKSRVLLAFCWKCRTYLLLWLALPPSTGHTSAAVSRLTCGWKSRRRKRDGQRQVSETLKIQERYQDPNTVSLWRIFWRNYLAVLYQWQWPLLVVAVLLSSRGVSELKRVTKYQLHFVGYGKYLASLPWMCAVVAEISTSVHKLLL